MNVVVEPFEASIESKALPKAPVSFSVKVGGIQYKKWFAINTGITRVKKASRDSLFAWGATNMALTPPIAFRRFI